MDKAQELLKSKFFPSTKEEWDKAYPEKAAEPKDWTSRLEAIENSVLGIGGLPPMTGRTFKAYCKMVGIKDDKWEEYVLGCKPWLRSDEDYARWTALHPFERFQYLTGAEEWK